ncbi:hypothetical protein C8Q74DRAFT_1204839 [Fomes fomentarius]|nr:hypothetical protein C8Q74DRAFT_1204839 [Fomes fomentarius]
MSGLIDRSLRGLHLRSARASVPPLPVTPTSPSAPTTSLPSVSQRQSVYDPATARPSSIVRPLSPTLDSLPAVPIVRHEPTIPEDAQPQSIPSSGSAPNASARGPIWPGLGQLHANPAMPSPALTEGSSTHAPDGLLDPRLSLLGQHGMQSQGAISFRDDMDYSRPIGEASWAYNRQYSRTTIQTVSTLDNDALQTQTQTLHTTAPSPIEYADFPFPLPTVGEDRPQTWMEAAQPGSIDNPAVELTTPTVEMISPFEDVNTPRAQ